MTYCVGLLLREGMVLLSDTRTNAGPDNIATFPKMHVVAPGDRVIALMTAGNLAVTQAVVTRVTAGLDPTGAQLDTLLLVPSMFHAARLVGEAIRETYQRDGATLMSQGVGFDASVIVAGQIKGGDLEMYLVYSAGNFIQVVPDTPFVQIGETKYGKPILDRVATFETPLEGGVKLALISMDSTLRSNFSVGLPADLLIYRRDSFSPSANVRVGDDDDYYRVIRDRWSKALRQAYLDLPTPPWG